MNWTDLRAPNCWYESAKTKLTVKNCIIFAMYWTSDAVAYNKRPTSPTTKAPAPALAKLAPLEDVAAEEEPEEEAAADDAAEEAVDVEPEAEAEADATDEALDEAASDVDVPITMEDVPITMVDEPITMMESLPVMACECSSSWAWSAEADEPWSSPSWAKATGISARAKREKRIGRGWKEGRSSEKQERRGFPPHYIVSLTDIEPIGQFRDLVKNNRQKKAGMWLL